MTTLSNEEGRELLKKLPKKKAKPKKLSQEDIDKRQLELVNHLKTPISLFEAYEVNSTTTEEGFTELTIMLSGEPIPKQSFKSGVTRQRNDGYHTCPWSGQQVKHKKGDVLVYKNKLTGIVDVIPVAYTDEKYVQKTKEYREMIKKQLPLDFIPFKEEVHVLELQLIHSPLASFSKTIIEGLRNRTLIKYKNTRGDWDNISKIVFDSLNDLVYIDDALIVKVDGIVKRYGFRAGVIIKLKGK